MSSTNVYFYVDLDGKQQGPVDIAALKEEWKAGEIDEVTLVWKPGQKGGWLSVKDLPNLKAQLTEAPKAVTAIPPPLPPPLPPSKKSSPRRPEKASSFTPSENLKNYTSETKTGASPSRKKYNHRSAITFSQEELADAVEFEKLKQNREKNKLAAIREAETAEADERDALIQKRRAEAKALQEKYASEKRASNQPWQEHFTPERLSYYVNKDTGEMSWEKPDVLKSSAELATAAGEWIWMPDKKEAYLPGKVTGRSGGKIQATGIDGRSLECKAGEEAGPITNFHSINMREDDLVQMLDVNEGSIIHCLRERFNRDLIYTAVGDILIALNPYVRLPLYTPEKVYEYSHRGSRRLPPHVFDIASKAYTNLCEFHRDVSILISGESGAGKTEATKQVLIYLSEVAGSAKSSDQIAQRVLSANPGLEAFGNAKTLRNNNSSRFGKFMQVYFDERMRIGGCQIENYLLEKSRVVMQLEGERNFHIFYMLCVAPSVSVRSALFLEKPQEYNYLNQSGCTVVDGMDDVREFEDVESALEKLNFTEDEKMDIYRVAAAVLHVGNIKFDPSGSDACKLHDTSQLTKLATLLCVDEASLGKTLVRREITLRGETVAVDLNVEKATAGRDALAKSLYGNLFDWLVSRTNKSLTGESGNTAKTNYIGILDIFGFEIFKSNSFEQLCINFCNEKLQQHFNRNTFVLEEDTYKSEGIEFEHIEYIDNQDVLNLIEKKPKGILVILDDEVSVPRGSDRGFYNKICKAHKSNPRFLQPRMAQSQFVINHYAGGVTYTIDDMVEKNKDRLEEDMAKLLTKSSSAFVSDGLYGNTKREIEQKKKGGGTRGSRYLRTQASVFRSSLQALMKRLNSTEPHYIRCIKTNAVKKPGIFKAPMCLEQLRYAGVFEAVSIRKQGYPFRFSHEDFYKRFRCITEPKLPILTRGFADGCKRIIQQTAKRPMASVVKNCKIGQTMILYRSKESAALELLRAIIAEKMAKMIQGCFRGLRCRILVRELKKHVPPLEEAVKSRSEEKLRTAIDAASAIWFEIKLLKEARAILSGLEREKELKVEIATLVTLDPDKHYDEYQKIISEMETMKLVDPGAFQDETSKKLCKAFKSVEDRRECELDLKDGCSKWNSAQLNDALSRLSKLKAEWGDFCPALEAEAQNILRDISAEKQEALKIKSLVDTGMVMGTPGMLNADNISTTELRKCINRVRDSARTSILKKAVRLGAALCTLRESVKEALLQDGDTRGDLWARVREALVAATQELGEAGKGNPELNLIQEDAAARAKIEEVAEKIRFATENLDEEWLTFGVDQAIRLHMDSHQSPKIRSTVSEAQKTLRMITDTKNLLQQGIDEVSMSKLDSGLKTAEKFKFQNDVVSEARTLFIRCVELKAMAETAHRRVVVELMRQSIDSCSRTRLKLPILDKMRALIALPEPKLLQRQLKAAVLLGEHDRVTSLTIRIKELFFDQAGGMFSFEKYPNLKPRNLFAKRYGVHNEHLKRNMLHWTSEPIHTSLTRLDGPGIDPAAKRHSTRVFKNILGYMGDRQYSYPILLAQEVTRCGLECPSVRDEIYCQIVKQLIDNPGKTSVARGWNLMALCLSTFPPSDEFENFLELFLRTNHQDRSVRKLHKIVYQGARNVPITVEEIEQIQHRGARFSIFGDANALAAQLQGLRD